MTESSPVKLKLAKRKLDIKCWKCLICSKRLGQLGRRPKEQGTISFINALNERKYCNGFSICEFEQYIDFDKKEFKEHVKDQIKWHVSCYAAFISKQNITGGSSSNVLNVPNTRASKPLINLKTNCIFCGFQKHNKVKKLVCIEYETVLQNIEKQCDLKKDTDLRLRIGGDFSKLPAFEAKYHATCYKTYMRDYKDRDITIHELCFDYLKKDISEILETGRAVELQSILSIYKVYLKENNYENFDSYTVQRLQARILNHFKDDVSFTAETNKSQYLYNSKISIADAINSAAMYKQMLHDQQLLKGGERNEEENILARAAEILRNKINEVKGIDIHPLNPSDITKEIIETMVPKELNMYLKLLCNVKDLYSTKISSIAQDIITLHSKGKKKMPKNVALGISLKNSLRSKEFITYLNNLGHCISYDDILRVETTWTSNILGSGDGYATIPSNIIRGSFAQAASDNGDYNQDNSSQHVTNTVIYQYNLQKLLGSFQPITTSVQTNESRIKRRSIKLDIEPLLEYNDLKKPELPRHYSENSIVEILLNEQVKSDVNKFSSTLNMSWVLLRITGNKLFQLEPQCIPDWTDYRKLISVKISNPTITGNCRSLPASPTDINVVYTMLVNVKKMLVNIGQPDPCVTVDESIYKMAKEIQRSVPYLKDVTIRLGGFHRIKNFMGVIGKRLRSSGIKELLEATGLFGSNQIEGM